MWKKIGGRRKLGLGLGAVLEYAVVDSDLSWSRYPLGSEFVVQCPHS